MGTLAKDFNPTPEGNLSRYLQVIRRYPMLTHEDEISLAERWRDDADDDAAHQLVNSHLRLVAKIAMAILATSLRWLFTNWCAASSSASSRQRSAREISSSCVSIG